MLLAVLLSFTKRHSKIMSNEMFCRSQENMATIFCGLREDSEILEETLVCAEEHLINAHRVTLSAYSQFVSFLLNLTNTPT